MDRIEEANGRRIHNGILEGNSEISRTIMIDSFWRAVLVFLVSIALGVYLSCRLECVEGKVKIA